MCSYPALITTSMMDDSCCSAAAVSHLPRKCTSLCQLMVIKLVEILLLVFVVAAGLTRWHAWAATTWMDEIKGSVHVKCRRGMMVVLIFLFISPVWAQTRHFWKSAFFWAVPPGVPDSLKYSVSSGLLSLAEIMWGSLVVWQEQIIAWVKCCRV